MPTQCILSYDKASRKTTIYLEQLNERGESQVAKYFIRAELSAVAGSLFSISVPRYACEILGTDRSIAAIQASLSNSRVYSLEDSVASAVRATLEGTIGRELESEFDLVARSHKRYEEELDCFSALLNKAGFETPPADRETLTAPAAAVGLGCLMM